jgi:hypothetical protein
MAESAAGHESFHIPFFGKARFALPARSIALRLVRWSDGNGALLHAHANDPASW